MESIDRRYFHPRPNQSFFGYTHLLPPPPTTPATTHHTSLQFTRTQTMIPKERQLFWYPPKKLFQRAESALMVICWLGLMTTPVVLLIWSPGTNYCCQPHSHHSWPAAPAGPAKYLVLPLRNWSCWDWWNELYMILYYNWMLPSLSLQKNEARLKRNLAVDSFYSLRTILLIFSLERPRPSARWSLVFLLLSFCDFFWLLAIVRWTRTK